LNNVEFDENLNGSLSKFDKNIFKISLKNSKNGIINFSEQAVGQIIE
jgi:hypothetical protein